MVFQVFVVISKSSSWSGRAIDAALSLSTFLTLTALFWFLFFRFNQPLAMRLSILSALVVIFGTISVQDFFPNQGGSLISAFLIGSEAGMAYRIRKVGPESAGPFSVLDIADGVLAKVLDEIETILEENKRQSFAIKYGHSVLAVMPTGENSFIVGNGLFYHQGVYLTDDWWVLQNSPKDHGRRGFLFGPKIRATVGCRFATFPRDYAVPADKVRAATRHFCVHGRRDQDLNWKVDPGVGRAVGAVLANEQGGTYLAGSK